MVSHLPFLARLLWKRIPVGVQNPPQPAQNCAGIVAGLFIRTVVSSFVACDCELKRLAPDLHVPGAELAELVGSRPAHTVMTLIARLSRKRVALGQDAQGRKLLHCLGRCAGGRYR